ncbi:hypothetical protein HLA87_02470 [Mycoplasma miroungigenitalium]|uniref:Uncharacterized protein n=1 Tax=Mycoplasma miroungigenitalium TaxID=754515 RepID=A0A6M4JC37_9MOLU|nr:hypothetical protein [Mycoplasma miroungigenitalium]QJR43639.1 hypothetical protein HLA87_02470 [Mycoplasma miroungigenitalium]
MRLKDFSGNLRLQINGDDAWAFSNEIKFSYHVTNFSKVIVNNVIHKSQLNSGKHFDYTSNFSDLDTFALATIYSDDKAIFTGLVNSQGRYSLNPYKVKDKSLELVDIRLWLSKKSPVDIAFIDISPTEALDLFINALNEKGRIKKGVINFSDNNNITAYDTTSKSPYSVLKEIIATQTRSFLYFTQDNSGNLLINFASEADFENKPALKISPNNWNDLELLDLRVEENYDGYFNRIRLESDSVIASKPNQQLFIVSEVTKSLWLDEPFGRLVEAGNPLKCYWYNLGDSAHLQPFELISKQEQSQGKNYHGYYVEDSAEIVLNPEWSKENVGVVIVYYSKNKQAITLENAQEIKRIHGLNNFTGDVYKFEQFNDISTFSDLFKQANNSLKLNSKPRKELTIETTKALLELGDAVLLDFNNQKFDGRYIVYGFNGRFRGSDNSVHVTYNLRNGLNSDTLINFYDSQEYKKNPLFISGLKTTFKYRDNNNLLRVYKNIEFVGLRELGLEIPDPDKLGLLPSFIPYTQDPTVNYHKGQDGWEFLAFK